MHMEDLEQDERPGMSQCLHGLYVDGSHEMTTVTARLARSIVLQLKQLLKLVFFVFLSTNSNLQVYFPSSGQNEAEIRQ